MCPSVSFHPCTSALTTMQLIDTHAHLDQIENIEEALRQADQAGVETVLAVGVDQASNQKNLTLKTQLQRPKIYCALGIHPEFAHLDEAEKGIEFIKKNISQATAIGEIGLDYWYKWVRKEEDVKERLRYIYRAQLEIAKEKNLPVTIHSRGAWQDCLDIAKDVGIKKAVFHWYSGPVDILDAILKCGYFISATPSLAYSPQAQEAIKHAPIEQTLIETDSPVYYKDNEGSGFQATPKDVFQTLKLYCGLKNLSEEKAAEAFNRNARELFNF
ncbi:MAG: TatD family hydrolase [Candidatus Omnitrophota bacterium]